MPRTSEVVSTLAEADRQFSIELTPDGGIPDDRQAIRWINRAIALMPHSPIPYVGGEDFFGNESPGIIAILTTRGRYPLLITYLKKAVSDPALANNYDILIALGDSELRMGDTVGAQTTYAAAITSINSSLDKSGTTFNPNENVFLERAGAEYYGGQRARAIKDFQTIISEKSDDSAAAANNLAYMFSLDKSNLPEALTLAKMAVAAARASGDDDDIGEYEDTLAWVEHQMGDDQDALFYEQEAASLTPLQADVQYHLGAICQAEALNTEARIAYTRAIKLNPFFPEARASLLTLPAQQASNST